MKRKSKSLRASGKHYSRMSVQELADATREFDREFVAETFGRAPKEAQAKLRRARRAVGRPRVGKGAKKVLITVERTLLAKADAYAKRFNINRSQMISEGLRRVIGSKAA